VIQRMARQRTQVRSLFSVVPGNARVMVVTEGIAAICFQWYGTYISLYMLALGVSAVQVGLLQSVLIFTKLISTLLGGYAADRFGRKRVLVVFDILCWGVPMFLYAIARNPWYFLAGRFINGFVYIVMPSFECLFVEDVPRENRAAVYGVLQFLMAGASLLAPAAGWLVAQWSIVPAGRVIMLVTMVSSVAMAIVRQFTLRETTVGQERMADTVGLMPLDMLREYVGAIRTAGRDRRIRTYLVVRNLVTFNSVMWATFSIIYLTDARGIGLAPSAVALFPFISALVTMGIILLVADRLQGERVFSNLILGQGLSVVASLLFVLSPPGSIWGPVLVAVGNAASVALFRSSNNSYWANLVGDRERALVFSASAALTALVTLPAGPLAGIAYSVWARGPFVLGIVLQCVALVLTLWLASRSPVAE